MFFALPILLPSNPESLRASLVSFVIGASIILNPSKELSSNGECSYPAFTKSFFVKESIFTIIVPPFFIQFLFVF